MLTSDQRALASCLSPSPLASSKTLVLDIILENWAPSPPRIILVKFSITSAEQSSESNFELQKIKAVAVLAYLNLGTTQERLGEFYHSSLQSLRGLSHHRQPGVRSGDGFVEGAQTEGDDSGRQSPPG